MREAATHAVEGVKMRLHLGAGGEPTAEQRTGEHLHMAKAAEGRNQAEDNPIDHALHDALKLERGEKPEVSAFPETLDDAVAVAQMKDLPSDPQSAVAAAAASAEGGGADAQPSPFGAPPARSRL
ncbi:histamine H2 receptor isoform X2 isoform A [Micractinium conductrix]|nr:histamine H2 receptor isoform X2 isoform A [Micractinium conductrix]|eukprot:PSC73758.1 histamine H2 receptor isoform X2 isoform A [Micractinium conductrix]